MKHVRSSLYCSLPEGRTFPDAPVVLNATPTIWNMSYFHEETKAVGYAYAVEYTAY